jgi:hypothetical protein
MTAITLRLWPAAWTTYDLPSGAREFLNSVLGVVGVGWCRSFLANVVSTSLQIKNGSPYRTWLDPFSGDVGLLMSVFYSSDFRSSGKKEKCRRPGGTRPHFELHVNIGYKPHNCIPLLVMHFKICVTVMSVQLDLKFLQIVNYVIWHPNKPQEGEAVPNCQHVMCQEYLTVARSSLPCSQELATGLCSQPDESNPQHCIVFVQDPPTYADICHLDDEIRFACRPRQEYRTFQGQNMWNRFSHSTPPLPPP